jgi:hypothetical protein
VRLRGFCGRLPAKALIKESSMTVRKILLAVLTVGAIASVSLSSLPSHAGGDGGGGSGNTEGGSGK